MAGLGIRNWELAQVLRGGSDITIAHGGSDAREEDGLRTVPFQPHAPHPLRPLITAADVIVAHPQWPLVSRWLRQSSARIVMDLYDPETLETLELLAGRPRVARRVLTAATLDRLHEALLAGDHFMCAAENQRDLWIGAMLGLRLIGPDVYDRDPSMRSVIDVVPFGLPDAPPPRIGGPGPRELLAQVDAGDELVLWNGGVWRWLDAPTAIRAVALLATRRPTVRLVFMGGGSHPAAAQSLQEARALATELGVLGSTVVFHDGWVPYDERAAWLAQASCGLSAARDHLETRFAFRTRVLDCLWAGLPVVCTSGDEMAARVAQENLGAVAPPGDAAGLADAIEQVLVAGRAAYAERLQVAAERYAWSRTAQPLLRWVHLTDRSPRLADAGSPLRPPAAQRAREVAYRSLVRPLLARVRGR